MPGTREAQRAGVSEPEYQAYEAGTTLLDLQQNVQVFKPGSTMESLPYAAQKISGFLQELGLAKTPPKLDDLLQPQFVNAVQ